MNIEIKIYIFMFLAIPIIGIVLINIDNESAADVIFIILNFYVTSYIYIDKNEMVNLNNEIYIKENNDNFNSKIKL